MHKRFLLFVAGILAGAGLFTGCSNSTSSSGTSLRVSFQDTAPPSPVGGRGGAEASAVSSVTVTRARVVIGRIRFWSDSGDSASFRTPEHEPLIVDLDLTGSYHSIGTVSIPPGSYAKTLFRMEKLEVADSAVYNANPDMQDLSIRVEGYVDGNPDSTFLFTSSLDEEQQRDLDTVIISQGDFVHIVFRFDHNAWFDDGGGGIIDPNEAQVTGLRSNVENNIKTGFDVFKP